jgi:hypothetical protein
MSHVESVNVQITDLEALKDACKRLGVEFVPGKKNYNWFGRSVGDYKLPEGFTAEELGKCEHVIKVPGVNYEIGVVPAKKGKGYTLLFDFWGSAGRHDGMKLKAKFGAGLTKLVDAYSIEALKRKAKSKGYLTTEKVVDGKTHLVVRGF